MSIGGIRRLRNRKIARTEQPTPDLVRIILEDGTVIEIPPSALRLMLDARYRQHVRAMVDPLADGDGIRQVTVSADETAESVTSSDLPAFELPPAVEEDLGESETQVVLRPVNVAFAEGNKWRFSDGDSTFYAAIEDIGFLSRIDSGVERFAKNDMLRVRLKSRQTRDSGGNLHTDRTVMPVVEHLSGAVQSWTFSPTSRIRRPSRGKRKPEAAAVRLRPGR
jgi:hypothetical protein